MRILDEEGHGRVMGQAAHAAQPVIVLLGCHLERQLERLALQIERRVALGWRPLVDVTAAEHGDRRAGGLVAAGEGHEGFRQLVGTEHCRCLEKRY